MKVRKLTAKDLHTLLEISGKISTDALQSITNNPDRVNEIQAAFAFVTAAMRYANADIKAFLCDLSGLRLEEYDMQPFSFPLDVLTALNEQEDLRGVFLQLKEQMNKIF